MVAHLLILSEGFGIERVKLCENHKFNLIKE